VTVKVNREQFELCSLRFFRRLLSCAKDPAAKTLVAFSAIWHFRSTDCERAFWT
jgi:hypothetical protein